MPSLKRALDYLLHNPFQFLDSCIKHLGCFLPDKLYLSLRYRCIMGKWIDWKNPKSFTEKIQWLKVYDFKPEYTNIVDKYTVKDYVASKIGDKYVVPTLGVWDSPDEIDWASLPNQFVLKTTHGGGGNGVIICSNKSNINKDNAKHQLNIALKSVDVEDFREHPYYAVPKRIIAESLLLGGGELKDYKFFCFNGVVKCFKIDFGRFVDHHANYYDRFGTILPYGEVGLEPIFDHIEKIPSNLCEMIQIAESLSNGFKFLRVDLYNVNNKIYFGELTFYPGSGMVCFTDQIFDNQLGDWLML